ncbi:aquaporin [Caenimonas aquaedulcis]|uniref:Aquaporin n=1 Tax=Caenimonas aquaedulcis TaxID=2793270 RepID=A0A931H511_9BURK|nr:aquaporin [Caenimonas aquaedulcis]
MRNLRRELFAEFIGTALLLCAVIGSGIMAERLSAGNTGVALLANTLATVFILYVLIEVLGPVSGAHFNPVVSVVLAVAGAGEGRARRTALFIAAQLAGAIAGAALANAMFDLSLLHASSKMRASPGQWLAEAVAAAGLIVVVLRAPRGRAAALVASYIGAAYWFTASTSFANPAAVLGRMMSDTFAGIAPASAAAFVAAQFAGGAVGMAVSRMLGPPDAQAG